MVVMMIKHSMAELHLSSAVVRPLGGHLDDVSEPASGDSDLKGHELVMRPLAANRKLPFP